MCSDRVDKPNSVPILPTGGGCRIVHPESVEGLALRFAQDAQFVQLPAAGKIGGSYLSGPAIASGIDRHSPPVLGEQAGHGLAPQ